MKKLLPKTYKNPEGFTLIELMIVITIIAILSVAGVTVFGNISKDARNATRKSDIAAISAALEQHYNDTVNKYCPAAAGTYCPVQATWFSGGVVPTDPGTAANYSGYPIAAAVATFNVCATLEPSGSVCKANQRN